jgi:WD40 repeat protein
MIISCGYWDHSFRVSNIGGSNAARLHRNYMEGHDDTISCLSMDKDYLATASNDGLINIWSYEKPPMDTFKLKHRLFGPLDRITCLDMIVDEDIIACGSLDNTVNLFTVQKGKHLRTNRFPFTPEILKISSEAYLAILCSSFYLYVTTINGKIIANTETKKTTRSMVLTKDGNYIITGEDEQLVVRNLYTLEIVKMFELPTIIRSISLSVDEDLLFVGLESGILFLLPFGNKSLN